MYRHRIKIFLAIVLLVFTGLLVRLGQLQLLSADDYLKHAPKMLNRVTRLAAIRGKIVDRSGTILAFNDPCFDLCLDYGFISGDVKYVRQQKRLIMKQEGATAEEAERLYEERKQATLQLVSRLSEESGEDLQSLIVGITSKVRTIKNLTDSVRGDKGLAPVEQVQEERQSHAILPGVDEATKAIVESQLDQTVGLSIQPGMKRVYPAGELACHIIGLTLPVTQEEFGELAKQQVEGPVSEYLPTDLIGKTGVEKMCESMLRGRSGWQTKRKRTGEVLQEQPAVPGGDVHLTLDIRLQQAVAEIWKKKFGGGPPATGSIVVLDVERGEILAMLSMPTYNLNTYKRDVREMSQDVQYLPLLNRAVGFAYPPGSTAKPITAVAGLEESVISGSTSFDCQGCLNPAKPDEFRCMGSHGSTELMNAIKHSCNVYFYNVGIRLFRLHPERLAEWFHNFGFDELPGSGLPEERRGVVPTSAWLAGRFERNDPRRVMRQSELQLEAIGQGMVLATPLHIAGEMAAIARGGEFISPVLVLENGTWAKQQHRRLPISRQHIEIIQKGMEAVVNANDGTAHNSIYSQEPGIDFPTVEFSGKTGTAQASPLYVNGREVRRGDMAWFSGYAPSQRPKIAFAVVVDYVPDKTTGGRLAAPIARDVVRACEKLGYFK